MKDKRERYLIFGIVFLVALVFAYLLTSLTINGDVTVGSNEWDVHFDNVVVDSGSVSTDDGAAIDEDDDTVVNFSVKLDQPRDYYKFNVDIVNEGTIDAMIESIDLPEIESELLEFNATYQDGTEISDNDLLASGEIQTITVVVNYKDDIDASDLDSENDDELEFSYGIDYVQADENAKPIANYLYFGDLPDMGEYNMNQAPPTVTYDNHMDLIEESGYNIFFKLKVVNELVVGVDLGIYIDNHTNYFLGATDDSDIEYNILLAKNIFGDENCGERSTTISDDPTHSETYCSKTVDNNEFLIVINDIGDIYLKEDKGGYNVRNVIYNSNGYYKLMVAEN